MQTAAQETMAKEEKITNYQKRILREQTRNRVEGQKKRREREAGRGEEIQSVTDSVHMPRRVVSEDKQAVIDMLRAQGAKTEAIAQTLGLSKSTVYQADHYAKRHGIKPILSRKRIKKATAAIDAFIEGQPVGDVKPKCSTVLAAANVVLDRAYPKAQEEGGKGNISFTQVNISLASGIASNPPIDVSPDPAPSLTGNNG